MESKVIILFKTSPKVFISLREDVQANIFRYPDFLRKERLNCYRLILVFETDGGYILFIRTGNRLYATPFFVCIGER